ncbi:tetratricopeptide repeat protein [Ekhidna sp.]
MRYLLYLILCISSISIVLAQNATIDSLENILDTQDLDTNKVNTLINLAFEWRYIDAAKTIVYANDAIALADDIDFVKGKAQALRNLGLGYNYMGNRDSAAFYVSTSRDLAQENGLIQIQADALNTLGNIHFGKSQYDSARMAFQQSYELFDLIKNYENRAVLLASIAVTYSEQGKYSKALEMYQESLLYFEENDNANMMANLYNNIANIYLERSDFNKAFEYYSNTSKYDSITGNKAGRAHTLLNMGNVLVHLKQIDQAKNNYWLSIFLANSSGSKCTAAMPMTQLGDLYLEEQIYDSAYHYISSALSLAQDCDNKRTMASVYLDLGEYYSIKGDLNKSEATLLEGFNLAKANDLIPNMEELSNALHKVYQRKGQYRSAYEFLAISKDLQNEQFNENSTKRITRLEAEYEFEKEKQIIAEEQKRTELAYEQELARERWMLISAGVLIVLISIIALFAYRSYKVKKTANLLLEEKNLRLAELREREKRLSDEAIASKERELATMAMASHEKNSLLSDLEQKVSFIEARIGDEMKTSLKEMKKAIADGYSLDKSWDSFLHRFEDVHPHFFDKLKDQNPILTVDDLKLSAYLKIGMSNKEIANVTHLTLGSVKSKINRLKKKLEMGPQDSLRDFMLKYA